MNTREIARLLAEIAIGDNRTVDKTVILYWEQIVPGWIPFDLARQAVIDHRRSSTDYLEPAHVIRLASAEYERLQETQRREAEWRELDEAVVQPRYSPSEYFAKHPEEWASLTPAARKIFRNMWPGDPT